MWDSTASHNRAASQASLTGRQSRVVSPLRKHKCKQQETDYSAELPQMGLLAHGNASGLGLVAERVSGRSAPAGVEPLRGDSGERKGPLAVVPPPLRVVFDRLDATEKAPERSVDRCEEGLPPCSRQVPSKEASADDPSVWRILQIQSRLQLLPLHPVSAVRDCPLGLEFCTCVN